jgi:hypothetical protein
MRGNRPARGRDSGDGSAKRVGQRLLALLAVLGIPLHVWPGGHDFSYWNAHWSQYLGFYAHALAGCDT